MPVPPDIYKGDVDFTALALRYPDFAKKLKANRQLDFSDPESVRQLTKALLDRDFNLKIDLPEDRLCPPVPNRFNYVLFVQRLLDSTNQGQPERHDTERRVVGIDIGTGASAIYPLLACRQYPSGLFLGTEIDSKSKESAIRNVKQNGLSSRIKIIGVKSDSDVLIPSDELQKLGRIDILMTNPPFYSSEAELQALAEKKSRPPNSACTGAPVEMIYPGGEVEFVSKLIRESALPHNRTTIQWFSSMFGKLGSLNTIIDGLKAMGCDNYAVTEFVQGQKTRRWCVAWSWSGTRPSSAVARGTDAVEKKYLPFPTELEMMVTWAADEIKELIEEEITALAGIEWHWIKDTSTGMGRSITGDVWSRRARRRLQKLATDQDSMDIDNILPANNSHGNAIDDVPSSDQADLFVFMIKIQTVRTEKAHGAVQEPGIKVSIRWLHGRDSTIFESFHGWLKRKLQQ